MNALHNPASNVDATRAFLLSLLQESRERFLSSFAGVTEEQARVRPAPDRWSVLDTVEHLTAAETLMVRIVTTQRVSRTVDAPNREEILLLRAADRSRKWDAPESAVPKGRFASLAEAAAKFAASRDEIIRFVEQSSEDLRATEVTHPHATVGVVSTCEMLIIMAKHAERHAAQIEEIRSALGLSAEAAQGQG
ncbi:MAG TPA: DinB family protein [Candidatus Sulfotelmatobacter sp.]|nr:DinB family protein [Candidatus Sulfotelmatobacter sp.]